MRKKVLCIYPVCALSRILLKMVNPQNLFSLCCIQLWDCFPQAMKNGPKSKKCLFCIKAFFHINEVYQNVPKPLLNKQLNYEFNIKKQKDGYNLFKIHCLTIGDRKMLQTFMVYHILYQFNFINRIILPDFYYIVGFTFVDNRGNSTNKFNLSCHNIFISTVLKGLKLFEEGSCPMLTKLKIHVAISKKPEIDLLDPWGRRLYEKKSRVKLEFSCIHYVFIVSILIVILLIYVLPAIFGT